MYYENKKTDGQGDVDGAGLVSALEIWSNKSMVMFVKLFVCYTTVWADPVAVWSTVLTVVCLQAWIHFGCVSLCFCCSSGVLKLWQSLARKTETETLFCWFSVQSSFSVKMLLSAPLHIIWIINRILFSHGLKLVIHFVAQESRLMKTHARLSRGRAFESALGRNPQVNNPDPVMMIKSKDESWNRDYWFCTGATASSSPLEQEEEEEENSANESAHQYFSFFFAHNHISQVFKLSMILNRFLP